MTCCKTDSIRGMHTTHLLYLHGFRSSPLSTKAQILAQYVATNHPKVHWWCPQLPASPEEAVKMVRQEIASWPSQSSAVIGSSLGGFYATVLNQRLGWRTVLINPAVEPARDLVRYIGEQTNWHNPHERLFFAPEFVGQLRALQTDKLKYPQQILTYIAKGDEVLDWREMQDRYKDSQMRLLEGGDHALSDFPNHLPEILSFLQLC
jgi:uncharacterized protein